MDDQNQHNSEISDAANLEQAEQHAQAFPTSPMHDAQPIAYLNTTNFFQRHAPLSVSLILFGLDLLCLLAAYLNNSYSFAVAMSNASVIIGLCAAVSLGVTAILHNIRTARKRQGEGRERPTIVTIMLGVVTFAVAGVVGLIAAFIVYGMTSDRACQLSSSKCY